MALAASSARRTLVVVRAGEKSLHRGWLSGERNWDLVVSWYGDEPYEPVADEVVLPAKGWKWDVLWAQVSAHPEWLEHYDYFWFPDDDIETSAADINRLIDMAARHGLEVCQPALTIGSYYSHPFTLVCPSFELRYSTFVEIMVPMLSRAALERVLPYFALSISGWGLDGLWSRLEANNERRAAIIDAVCVRHTRPIGVFLKGRMEKNGLDPRRDWEVVRARFGLEQKIREFPCYAGLSRRGRYRGAAATWLLMLRDYWRQRRRIVSDDLAEFFALGFKYGLRGTSRAQRVDAVSAGE